MYVSQLILELTRRCNMQCLHCIRGNAQSLSMSQAVIGKVFSQIDVVSSLCLSGGEPSLAVPVIEKITEHIIMNRVEVNNFYVVSNGKAPPQRAKKFARALLSLYSVLSSPEKEMTGLTISGDAWHEPVEIPQVYHGLGFFIDDRHGPRSQDGVILDGRAELNGIGRRAAQRMASFETEDNGSGNLWVGGDLYIAANGNVTSTCDLSYARIDGESLGNVLNEPLETIITRWEAEYERGKAVGAAA